MDTDKSNTDIVISEDGQFLSHGNQINGLYRNMNPQYLTKV